MLTDIAEHSTPSFLTGTREWEGLIRLRIDRTRSMLTAGVNLACTTIFSSPSLVTSKYYKMQCIKHEKYSKIIIMPFYKKLKANKLVTFFTCKYWGLRNHRFGIHQSKSL